MHIEKLTTQGRRQPYPCAAPRSAKRRQVGILRSRDRTIGRKLLL